MRPLRWTARGLAAAALALVTTGCSSGSSHRSSTTTSSAGAISSTSSSLAPSTSAPTTRTTLAGAGVSPVSTPVSGRALLTAVRVSTNDGFDRVVFEFEGGPPGYSVQYVERPVREDGSGKEVQVGGDSVLEVRMEHASGADLSGSNFRQTYTGPHRIPVNGPAAVEAVQSGDFEGVLHWVIGTHGRQPFVVHLFSGPTRIVVDIQDPPAPG